MATTPDYQALARQFASVVGIDPGIFVNQIQQESGFNPRATSPAGAQGIAQFMPATAAGMGINPWNAQQALQGAATLDMQNLKKYNGDYAKMLSAYNAGGGATDYAVNHYGSAWLSHMPSETQQYVATIMKKGASPASASAGTGSSTAVAVSGTGSTPGILGQLKQWGEYAAIFALAILLLIIGFLLLAKDQTVAAAKTAVKAAVLA